MNSPVEDRGRLKRNLLWQASTDPNYYEHQSRVAAIIEKGGVLRCCTECGCAQLYHEPVRVVGEEAFTRCISCGNLEAE